MLLDPFEKQFHLPACLVERADCRCWQDEIVGKEYQRFAGLGIFVTDAAQMFGIVLAAGGAGECDGLIADDTCVAIHHSRIDALEPGVRLGAGDEKGLRPMHRVKPCEVQITPIHDVDRSGLQHQDVERFDVAQLAVGDVDEAGESEARGLAAQVEQRMHLHRRLRGAKQRPRKERQAQVDGRRIQRVDRVRKLDAKAVARIELARLFDQVLGKFCVNTPVARLVGIGQRRALGLLPQTHVVELGRLRREADFDVAQALAVRQLREGHHAELIGACHGLDVAIAIAAIDDAMEGLPGEEVHELSEQRFAVVHGSLQKKNRNTARTAFRRSNRRHPSLLGILRQSWISAIRPLV